MIKIRECEECGAIYAQNWDSSTCTCGGLIFEASEIAPPPKRHKYGVKSKRWQRTVSYCPTCMTIYEPLYESVVEDWNKNERMCLNHSEVFLDSEIETPTRRNVRVIIVFDSIAEKRRFPELVALLRAGEISDLVWHPKYLLQDKFVTNQGKKRRAIWYLSDFQYVEDGVTIVEDVKGGKVRTPVFQIKKKLFEAKYADLYTLRIVER